MFSAELAALLLPAGGVLLAAGWAWRRGDRFVLTASGAKPLNAGDPSKAVLVNVVEEMAVAAGIPGPRIYVIEDPDPNAFAVGRAPDQASIVVTRGLLDALTRDELQAVVGHEVAHIRNLDILPKTMVAALLGGVLLLIDAGARELEQRQGLDQPVRPDDLLAGVMRFIDLSLTSVIVRGLALTVSRQREHLADATAAQLTRNAPALASALTKLAAATTPTRRVARGTAHLCIVDPLDRRTNDDDGPLADFLGTHPPVPTRLARLRSMAGSAAEILDAPLAFAAPVDLPILSSPPRAVPVSLRIERLANRSVLAGALVVAIGAALSLLGADADQRAAALVLGVIVALIGAVFVVAGVVYGRRIVRLLRHGVLAPGRATDAVVRGMRSPVDVMSFGCTGCIFVVPALVAGPLFALAALYQLATVVILGWPASIDGRLVTDRWEATAAVLPFIGTMALSAAACVWWVFGFSRMSMPRSRGASLLPSSSGPTGSETGAVELPAGREVDLRFEFATPRGERIYGHGRVWSRVRRVLDSAEPVLYDPERPLHARLLGSGALTVLRSPAGDWVDVSSVGPAVRVVGVGAAAVATCVAFGTSVLRIVLAP